MVELVLTPPATGAVPAELDWSSLPGVVDAARRGRGIVLRVAREHSDTVLMTALQHLWSVDAVTRAAHDHGSRTDARSAAR
jgi:hypothetical protein